MMLILIIETGDREEAAGWRERRLILRAFQFERTLDVYVEMITRAGFLSPIVKKRNGS